MTLTHTTRSLRIAALAASLSAFAWPSAAKDIVAFVDEVTEQAKPSNILILHNKQAWLVNIMDTMVARLRASNYKFSLEGYNQGERPRDIARKWDWASFGAVFCLGEPRDCDGIKAEADKKDFEGDFYNYMLSKR